MKIWWFLTLCFVIAAVLGAGCTNPKETTAPVKTPAATLQVSTTVPFPTGNVTSGNASSGTVALPGETRNLPVQVTPSAEGAINTTPVQVVSQPEIIGSWTLSSITTGANTTVPVPGSGVFAVFSTGGNLTGSAGCNAYFATWKEEGNTLIIGPIGSTRRACEPPVMEQEAGYLSLLENVTRYLVRNGTLTLSDSGRNFTMVLQAGS